MKFSIENYERKLLMTVDIQPIKISDAIMKRIRPIIHKRNFDINNPINYEHFHIVALDNKYGRDEAHDLAVVLIANIW